MQPKVAGKLKSVLAPLPHPQPQQATRPSNMSFDCLSARLASTSLSGIPASACSTLKQQVISELACGGEATTLGEVFEAVRLGNCQIPKCVLMRRWHACVLLACIRM